ncbi:MAG: 50S ribosomal protein L13 [Phycisphaerales bacterium]|nr:MAG: 50S ribosomal protein L13 [Phycisphaerales bacterium]
MPRQTTFAKNGDITKKWHIVDARGKILGRLATEVATILMGKHRPEYTPHVDCGDFVIVTNAKDVKLTGNKLEDKTFQKYSQYPGGLKIKTYGTVLAKHPERLIEKAVTRMLPKNRLGRQMAAKLKVYAGEEHPHTSQRPEPLEV